MHFIANPDADINGTSFHDVTIKMDYRLMVKFLGEPHFLDGDKTQYEWRFTGEDGNSVAIYDWKSNSKYPKIWNLGGMNKEITSRFKDWFYTL